MGYLELEPLGPFYHRLGFLDDYLSAGATARRFVVHVHGKFDQRFFKRLRPYIDEKTVRRLEKGAKSIVKPQMRVEFSHISGLYKAQDIEPKIPPTGDDLRDDMKFILLRRGRNVVLFEVQSALKYVRFVLYLQIIFWDFVRLYEVFVERENGLGKDFSAMLPRFEKRARNEV